MSPFEQRGEVRAADQGRRRRFPLDRDRRATRGVSAVRSWRDGARLSQPTRCARHGSRTGDRPARRDGGPGQPCSGPTPSARHDPRPHLGRAAASSLCPPWLVGGRESLLGRSPTSLAVSTRHSQARHQERQYERSRGSWRSRDSEKIATMVGFSDAQQDGGVVSSPGDPAAHEHDGDSHGCAEDGAPTGRHVPDFRRDYADDHDERHRTRPRAEVGRFSHESESGERAERVQVLQISLRRASAPSPDGSALGRRKRALKS